MSYEKQTWQTGDIITAEKLNHIEDGIEDCSGGSDSEFFIVDMVSQDGATFTASESRGDILDAITDGKVVLARYKFAMGDSVAVGGTSGIRYWMGAYSALIDYGMKNIEGTPVATIKYIRNTPAADDYTWEIVPQQ